MTYANELRAIVDSALSVELEAGIAWTTLYDRLHSLGTLVNQIEIQEALETLPGLRKSMEDLTALDTKLHNIKTVLEEIRARL